MKKRVVILFGVFLLILGSCVAYWMAPEAKVSLEFVRYQWQPTNNTWYAELRLINDSREMISFGTQPNSGCANEREWEIITQNFSSAKPPSGFAAYLAPNQRMALQVVAGGWLSEDHIHLRFPGDTKVWIEYVVHKKSLGKLQPVWVGIKRVLGMDAAAPVYPTKVWCDTILSVPQLKDRS